MELKELVRNIIQGELGDILLLEAEAEAFGGQPGRGAAVGKFFLELAGEKRGRLDALRAITKEGTGLRQRHIEPAKSPEAALRALAARAGTTAGLYAQYAKYLSKPDQRQAVLDFSAAELRALQAVRALQAALKK